MLLIHVWRFDIVVGRHIVSLLIATHHIIDLLLCEVSSSFELLVGGVMKDVSRGALLYRSGQILNRLLDVGLRGPFGVDEDALPISRHVGHQTSGCLILKDRPLALLEGRLFGQL